MNIGENTMKINDLIKNLDVMEGSGLQYHTGVKKHGKEYMDKAAQAGREGASQEELGRLKDRYSKAEKNKKTSEAIATDNFDLTPQQREIVALGHVLKTQAATVKDDALSNAMARVGDELTSYGATFGPKNAKDVEKKSGVSMPVIKKLMSFAKKVQSETDSLKKDHTDGGLDDTNDTDDDYGSATKADAFAKSKMGEDENILDPLKAAAAELFGKQPKKEDPEKIALDQAMKKYKNNPKGLKAWLMKNRNILLWLNTNDSQMLDMVKQRIGETTSAGSVASVAAPIGGMQKRNPDGTAKNALDGDNIFGKPKNKSRKSKK